MALGGASGLSLKMLLSFCRERLCVCLEVLEGVNEG
jgi:hypothetical protein